MKVHEVLRLLSNDGWFVISTRGSHRQLKDRQKLGRVTVPGKPNDDLACGHCEQYSETGWFEVSSAMRYGIVIERAGANYSAYVPDLPGCVATGKTIAEVQQEIRAAIEFHIEGMKEDGLPVPAPSSVCDYVEVC